MEARRAATAQLLLSLSLPLRLSSAIASRSTATTDLKANPADREEQAGSGLRRAVQTQHMQPAQLSLPRHGTDILHHRSHSGMSSPPRSILRNLVPLRLSLCRPSFSATSAVT